MGPFIREAADADLDGILELYLDLHEKTIPDQNSHLLQTWKQILEDKNHHLIVLEENGKIVSSCDCIIIPNLTRNARSYALIENVVTARSLRKKGYASRCLDYAVSIARDSGCYKIMLLTGSKEKEILDFYKQAGFNSSDKTAFIQWIGPHSS